MPWCLFLDVDGTLLEIAVTPDAVRVDDHLCQLLPEVSHALDGAVALVSGRAIAALDRPGHHGLCRLPDGKGRGARVVTSAGSDAEVDWLRKVIKADHACNYRSQDIGSALRDACPKGIDVLLENASPEHLCACLPVMNLQKQVLIAGFAGTYNLSNKFGPPENFEYVLDQFLTIQSYPFMDSLDRYEDFVADMIRWRAEGRIHLEDCVYEGLDRAAEAPCALLEGRNIGKSLVRLAN